VKIFTLYIIETIIELSERQFNICVSLSVTCWLVRMSWDYFIISFMLLIITLYLIT